MKQSIAIKCTACKQLFQTISSKISHICPVSKRRGIMRKKWCHFCQCLISMRNIKRHYKSNNHKQKKKTLGASILNDDYKYHSFLNVEDQDLKDLQHMQGPLNITSKMPYKEKIKVKLHQQIYLSPEKLKQHKKVLNKIPQLDHQDKDIRDKARYKFKVPYYHNAVSDVRRKLKAMRDFNQAVGIKKKGRKMKINK